MSVIAAAIISFFAFALIAMHMQRSALRKLAGYAMYVDIVLHFSVIALFFGTSTLGLMQAELSAILFSLSLRIYRWLIGYSRIKRVGPTFAWRRPATWYPRVKWVTTEGRLTASR